MKTAEQTIHFHGLPELPEPGTSGLPELKEQKWNDFIFRNHSQLEKISHSRGVLNEEKKSDEAYSAEFVYGFFEAMKSYSTVTHPISKDIESLKNGISAVIQLKTEKILEPQEATALVDFIMGRFVERRFDRIFQKLLPSRDSKKWFYGTCETHFIK